MEKKMPRENKKKELKDMLEMTDMLDDLDRAHILGYVKGMSTALELKKKEAS